VPLHRERSRCDDEDPIRDTSKLQLLEQETGHDRLASARVVCKDKAKTRLREEMPVNGFDLMQAAHT